MNMLLRLEHPTTLYGAYHGLFACGSWRQNYSDPMLHPSPLSCGEVAQFSYRDIFGFSSLSAARRWFFDEQDLRDWHRGGLRLAVWRYQHSDKVLEGYSQVAFTRPAKDPLYLPAYAIHAFDEATINDLLSDWDIRI
ncbi:hypothetical protein [Novosphingobium sp. LASN5T]|uniref:hypothetical protein n=1 Tax=Novosphingobium sp. LASN5T TaxID=2491021 RepID=UPI000F5FB4D2|nr:hypothetical protein [Novosphingobium sp. LASN5T]RQW44671.1 hypothetical protein EH199_08030 [Novosphingobium sp. LASN5T]